MTFVYGVVGLPVIEGVLHPQSALLSYHEVINWIAFNRACEDFLIGSINAGVHRVLQCMRDNQPLYPPAKTPAKTPKWAIVDSPSPGVAEDIERATAIVQSTGLTPGEILAELHPYVKVQQERDDRWHTALEHLVEAILEGDIAPRPAPNDTKYADRSSPSGLLALPFHNLMPGWFPRKKVLELWPAPFQSQREDNLSETKPTPPAPERSKMHNGLNYKASDAPLIDRMHQLMCEAKATSPEDAARAVVADAIGSGSPSSKVTRLAAGYRRGYRNQS